MNLEGFDLIDTGIPNGELGEKMRKVREEKDNILFVPIYSDDRYGKGWYDVKFDRRKFLDEIIKKHPEWTYLIDKTCQIKKDPKNFIYVNDIYDFLEENYKKKILDFYRNCGKTIAITGSVGKTTTVTLLEEALKKNDKNILRLYSKRITPVLLYSMVLNFLEPKKTNFILTEFSMYYRHHIEWLSKNLPPHYAGILNIEKNHQGVDGIKSKRDILDAKVKIYNPAYTQRLFYNLNDDFLNSEIRRYFGSSDKILGVDYKKIDAKKLNIPTKLSLTQLSFIKEILKELDLNSGVVYDLKIGGKEGRLDTRNIGKNKVILDKEPSNGSRFKKIIIESFVEKPVLILEGLFFVDDLEPQKELLEESFKKSELYLIKGIKIPDKIKDIFKKVKYKIVSKEEMIKILIKNEKDMVVWHKPKIS